MAKWGGEADATKETAGGGGGNFPPAPRGFYTIQVADYKDGQTKGDPEKGVPVRNKVDLTCEIADEGEHFGKKVWLTITQIPKDAKGHGIMVHQLHAFGLALDGNYDFDTSELQGRQAKVLLGVEPRQKVKDGVTYVNEVNFVEELYTEKHPQPEELPAPRQKKTAAAPAAAKPGQPLPPNMQKAGFKGTTSTQPRQQEVPF